MKSAKTLKSDSSPGSIINLYRASRRQKEPFFIFYYAEISSICQKIFAGLDTTASLV